MIDEKKYYILKEDIKSLANPKLMYGKKGEKVLLISRSDTMLIVKGVDNNRFALHIKNCDRYYPPGQQQQTTLF
jgi:hypothetical protein